MGPRSGDDLSAACEGGVRLRGSPHEVRLGTTLGGVRTNRDNLLDAVRAQGTRGDLAGAAHAVAAAAAAFNAEAYRALHNSEKAWMPLDQSTERTEVLAELWLDLATAYEA